MALCRGECQKKALVTQRMVQAQAEQAAPAGPISTSLQGQRRKWWRGVTNGALARQIAAAEEGNGDGGGIMDEARASQSVQNASVTPKRNWGGRGSTKNFIMQHAGGITLLKNLSRNPDRSVRDDRVRGQGNSAPELRKDLRVRGGPTNLIKARAVRRKESGVDKDTTPVNETALFCAGSWCDAYMDLHTVCEVVGLSGRANIPLL
ncbi:hypothetical protein B0H17DRAFT_1130181 [Mycena rosella]|uniref:Uncharacterized protein n=1 Tax=Mycena rosella TaxID=1033263 RepID=A0AAD7DRV8_MYCRO|nr:hypothetical protein B0H17DRAFT_1130181 [Mycena rosella]